MQHVNMNKETVKSDDAVFDPERNVLDFDLDKEMVLPDPCHFIAGSIHKNKDVWGKIIEDSNSEVLNWVNNYVDIHDFMQPFKGTFWGIQYDDVYPPPRYFNNAANCQDHMDFINDEITSRLRSGAVTLLGKVGEVQPPHIVSPITIEPTKPRLCINLMYLNSFMKDTPFNLDTLVDVPKTVRKGSFLTKLDDKSGYDNVFVTESSRPLLGFEWGGYFFCCNTLPFGWKNSAFVYHTLNLQGISFLRRKFISCLLYIDDRLIEEFHGNPPNDLDNPIMRSHIAVRYAVKLFVSLGYFLNIDKSSFLPKQSLTFLGMIIDTVCMSFFITEQRKHKFAMLREKILNCNSCPVSLIQKFTGMCISLSLAIPGAKLYTSVCNRAISKAARNSMTIQIDSNLREEVSHWKFLDNWKEPLPWIAERHHVLSLFSDASDFKWGVLFFSNGQSQTFSDYWSDEMKGSHIMIKEALALKNAIISLGEKVKNSRIDAKVDNKALVFAWNNQYSKNEELNKILKDIFQLTFNLNINLSVSYVHTSENPADGPSRSLSKSDASITKRTWWYLQYLFGPHTVDMFSIDSNTMFDEDGKSLPHFTPFPTPLSSGVDAFAQKYIEDERYYAFPPFCLISTVVNFILQERLSCTLVFPDFKPVQPWFPVVLAHASQVVPIGFKGDTGVLLYPSKKGFLSDKKGLQWNLLAASFCSDRVHKKFEIDMLPHKNFVPVLIIGDSIIKFLSNTDKNVHVISISGGKLLDCYFSLVEFLQHSTSFVVIFHCGTNDVNKSAKPASVQLENAMRDLNKMFHLVSELQKVKKFAFIFSGCVCTKNDVINLRIDKLNNIIKELCKKGRHLYIDQSNISSSDLRDVVHLNESGQLIFVRNLSGFL